MEPVLLPYFGDFVANMHEIQWKERWADQHEYLTIEDNRMSSNTMSTSGSVLTRGRVVDFSQYAEVADMYEKGSRPQSQKGEGTRSERRAKRRAKGAKVATSIILIHIQP